MTPAPGGDAAAVVVTHDLTRRFGDVIAVDRVTFSIAAGEIFALIGPNGAGKSTLIKMLTTLLPPSGGTAKVVGFDIAKAPAQVRRPSAMFPSCSRPTANSPATRISFSPPGCISFHRRSARRGLRMPSR